MQEQTVPRIEPDAPPRELAPFDWRLLGTVALAGALAYGIVTFTTPAPAPAHEHAQNYGLLDLFFSTAWFGCLFVGGYALVQRQFRWGYSAIAAASWVLLAAVVACPASGHHDFGVWWAGQMAMCLVFVAVATVASAISLRAPEPARRSQP